MTFRTRVANGPASRRFLVVALLSIAPNWGCAILDAFQGDCTLIGCYSGLSVVLGSTPTGTVTIEVLPASHTGVAPVTLPFACHPTGGCRPTVLFEGMLVRDFTVRVTTTDGVLETQFRNVAYRRHQPNGDGCEPVCWDASVTVELPGLPAPRIGMAS